MNNQVLLIIQSVFVILMIWWLLSKRDKPRAPTQLNMTTKGQNGKSKYQNINYEVIQSSTKDLNVVFMWNGHSWDSYEVLGIPAGSSYEVAEKKFNELIANDNIDSDQKNLEPQIKPVLYNSAVAHKNRDQGQIEFYQAALSAIRNKLK